MNIGIILLINEQKINKNIKPVDFNDLIYYCKGSNEPINFNECKGMMNIFKSIHSDDETLEDVEQEQNKFKKEINIIKQGNPKKKYQKNKKKQ